MRGSELFPIGLSKPWGHPSQTCQGLARCVSGAILASARQAFNGVVDYLMFGQAVHGATVLYCNLSDFALLGAVILIGVSMYRVRRATTQPPETQ